MDKEKVLNALAEQCRVPVKILEDKCKESTPILGLPTLLLIDLGAVTCEYATLLKLGEDFYEPAEYTKVKFTTCGPIGSDNCIRSEAKIPVSYTKRGEIFKKGR